MLAAISDPSSSAQTPAIKLFASLCGSLGYSSSSTEVSLSVSSTSSQEAASGGSAIRGASPVADSVAVVNDTSALSPLLIGLQGIPNCCEIGDEREKETVTKLDVSEAQFGSCSSGSTASVGVKSVKIRRSDNVIKAGNAKGKSADDSELNENILIETASITLEEQQSVQKRKKDGPTSVLMDTNPFQGRSELCIRD